MKELVYVVDSSGMLKTRERNYSNPRFFSTPRPGYDKITIVGNYPNIERAYKDKGVEVQVTDEIPPLERPLPVLGEVPVLSDEEVLKLSWNDLVERTVALCRKRPVSKAQAYEWLEIELPKSDDGDEEDE